MADFTNKSFHRGDGIPAEWANWVNRRLSTGRISGGPGLVTRMGPTGPQVAFVGQTPVTVASFTCSGGITAATWSGGVPTAWGTGTGYRINDLSDVDSTGTTIQSAYADAVDAADSGKLAIVTAYQDSAGDWWLLTPSCTEVDAS